LRKVSSKPLARSLFDEKYDHQSRITADTGGEKLGNKEAAHAEQLLYSLISST
jgi:hypothetical protein